MMRKSNAIHYLVTRACENNDDISSLDRINRVKLTFKEVKEAKFLAFKMNISFDA